ncbi:E-selectin-like [Hyperolius riggenbachi]|uniref:E-selectin-like n=1 Tax=Hyperolius riggenbachi TaxID=752182 RepID=UPI0035A35D06
MACIFYLFLTMFGFSLMSRVQGWTYHTSPKNMSYDEAYTFCTTKYTAMVAIQNREENTYLNNILPLNPSYYWIGIRKNTTTGDWTWVGTKKKLTEEAKNWANREPNNLNKNKNEDCVEMYVKRPTEEGKWNDISCSEKKVALCYTASCHPSSCNNHGECVETINNYTCRCYDGFYGTECKHVVTCPELHSINNGSVECSHVHGDFTYESSCHFSCSEGNELVGPKSLQCMARGDWGDQTPYCKVVSCSEVNSIDHGSVTCSNVHGNFAYQSSCNFSCSEGYELVGSESLQCMATGEWEDQIPHCKAVSCLEINGINNGSVECSHLHGDLTFESSCHFSCSEGYDLVGSESLQCVATGEWDDQIPHCKVVTCPEVNSVDHGLVTCSHVHGDFAYQSSCNFSCSEGYELVGSKKLQCTASREWEDQIPHCKAVSCPEINVINNGSVECSQLHGDFTFESSCHFSCSEGYELVGSESLQCLATGEWGDLIPHCKAVSCPKINLINNGSVECSHLHGDFTFESSCHFSCSEGYELVGLESLQCTATGEWGDLIPHCKVVTCPEVNSVDHGLVTCSHVHGDFAYQSSCNFSCSEGYELVGSKKLQCTARGEWGDQIPHCKAVSCPEINGINNGSVECSQLHGDFTFESSCHFSCSEGYELVGSGSLQCTATGEWGDLIPHCKAVSCPKINLINNGSVECSHLHGDFTFESSCHFSCSEGYELVGPESLQCVATGEWDDQIPHCKVATCPEVNSVDHGLVTCSHVHGDFAYQSSCNFTCSEGYELVGSKQLQCTASGEWGDQIPHCKAVSCPEVNGINNGSVECSHLHGDFTYESSCHFSCSEGYELVGSESLQCTATGKWDDRIPHCKALTCEPLFAPFMGNITCTHLLGEFQYGSLCTFDCELDWILNGTSTVMCSSNGNWTAAAPSCEAEKKVPEILATYATVGIALTSTSVMSTVMLLLWLVKRFRKTASTFTPSSKNYQHLEELGVYQNTGNNNV